jgi:hypothetical protein
MSDPLFSANAYSPPGTYISEQQSPLAGITSITPEVVAIVGPSRGFRTAVEAIVLTGTTATGLANGGVDNSSVVVSSLAGVQYDLTTDYTVATVSGVTQITRVTDGAIESGEAVRVAYEFTDDDYFAPLEVLDYDDVKDAYGEPYNPTTGAILSPLSFAAQLAFQNGANRLVLVATDSSSPTLVTRAELTDAYDLLQRPDIGFVVPLPAGMTGTSEAPGDIINVGSDLGTHVDTASADGMFRIGMYGAPLGSTVDPATIAGGVANRRVVVAHPAKMNYYNGHANQTIEVDGFYLAAAMAGRAASLPVQMPLTRKRISGFSGIPSSVLASMTKSAKDAWATSGVALVELDRRNALVIRHGVTTDPSNVLTREMSVVRARDLMVIRIQDTLDNSQLIGSPILEDTPLQVKSVVAGVLESLLGEQAIVEYTELKARIASVDPSVIQVKFEYRPAYPLNYVLVTFSVNLTEGTIEEV